MCRGMAIKSIKRADGCRSVFGEAPDGQNTRFLRFFAFLGFFCIFWFFFNLYSVTSLYFTAGVTG